MDRESLDRHAGPRSRWTATPLDRDAVGPRASGPRAGGPRWTGRRRAGRPAGGRRRAGPPTHGRRRAGDERVPRRTRARLERQVVEVIGAQLAGRELRRARRGPSRWPIGPPAAILGLTLRSSSRAPSACRSSSTGTGSPSPPPKRCSSVGFFVVGPIGLAVAFAVAESREHGRAAPLGAQGALQRRQSPGRGDDRGGRVRRRFGRTYVHDMAAWAAALAAALCFSLLDVVGHGPRALDRRGDVVSRRLRALRVDRAARDAHRRAGRARRARSRSRVRPSAVLLLVPVAAAVALNSRYAVAQRDEHLRFERLYESSARTASLVGSTTRCATRGRDRGRSHGMAALCCDDRPVNGSGRAADRRCGNQSRPPARAAVALAERTQAREGRRGRRAPK